MRRRTRKIRFSQHPTRALPGLRRSLRRIHITIILLSLVLTGITTGTAALFALRSYASENLTLATTTLSYAAQELLTGHDIHPAGVVLAAMGQEGRFASAQIEDSAGDVVASWPVDAQPVAAPLTRWLTRWVFPRPLVLPVKAQGAEIGMIKVTGSPAVIVHYLKQIAFWLSSCLLVTALLAFWLCQRMHAGIVKGLQNIATVAHDVRTRRAFDQRVPSSSIAELHELSGDFNSLLEELARWQKHMQAEHSSLSHQAQHDALTGLLNRLAFERHLQRLYDDTQTRNRFGVLYLDGDRFKQINDSWGHAAGDHVLKITAQRLRHRLRSEDKLARLGGDEFAVLVTHVPQEGALAAVAQALMEAMAQPILLPNGITLIQSLSIGAALSEHHPSPESLMAAADAAMYQAKGRGGGRFQLATWGLRALSRTVTPEDETQQAPCKLAGNSSRQ